MKDSRAAIPIAMMFLVIGILWPKITFLTAHLGAGVNDFVRGASFGLSIAINLLAVIAMRRQRCRTDESVKL